MIENIPTSPPRLYKKVPSHIIVLLLILLDISNSLQLLPLRRRVQRNLAPSPYTPSPHNPSSHPQTQLNFTSIPIISITVPLYSNETERQRLVDDHLMGLALQQAEEAGTLYGEVPIGALIAQLVAASTIDPLPPCQNHEHGDSNNINVSANTNNTTASASATASTTATTTIQMEILSHGQNQIETYHDASAHAELQALRSAGRTVQNWRLLKATLYTTLEPCPMCLSAAQAFRVARIVYGAPDLRLGAVETYMNLLDYPHPFHDAEALEVVGGVRSEEARLMLVQFFRDRRKEGKRKKDSSSSLPLLAEDVGDGNGSGDGENSPTRRGRMRQYLSRLFRMKDDLSK